MGQALLKSRSANPAADAVWMAETVMQYSPATDSEALKLLRTSFPDCPLSLRVAALNLLMRNNRRTAALPR
ncbi:MAG TPA: hypothetical protein VNR39_03285 [Pseudolabrys sp.]|nr:hypothetical protein [Pseudolabrys sp.]